MHLTVLLARTPSLILKNEILCIIMWHVSCQQPFEKKSLRSLEWTEWGAEWWSRHSSGVGSYRDRSRTHIQNTKSALRRLLERRSIWGGIVILFSMTREVSNMQLWRCTEGKLATPKNDNQSTQKQGIVTWVTSEKTYPNLSLYDSKDRYISRWVSLR